MEHEDVDATLLQLQLQTIVVMRHGQRVDAVVEGWHGTAQHPWDPPLAKAKQGGNQVGMRVACRGSHMPPRGRAHAARTLGTRAAVTLLHACPPTLHALTRMSAD